MTRRENNQLIETIADDAVQVAAGVLSRSLQSDAATVSRNSRNIALTVIRKIREQYHIRRKVKS